MRPAVLTLRFLICFVIFAAWGPVSVEAQAADEILMKRPLDKIKRIDLKQVYPQFEDRWRQVFPLPTTQRLNNLWIGANGRVWFVGNYGTVISVDIDKIEDPTAGVPWRVWDVGIHPNSRDTDFQSIWGDQSGTIYVSDPNRSPGIYSFDGKQWKKHSDPGGRLCGLGPKQVYAMQNGGRVFRFDGQKWSEIAKSPESQHFLDAWPEEI